MYKIPIEGEIYEYKSTTLKDMQNIGVEQKFME
jgi:hypothetical protein